MNTQIQHLLTKEMGRREFLKYIGAVLLAMVGVSGLMRAILQNHDHATTSHSYGAMHYGGPKR